MITFEIPKAFAAATIAREGEAGRAWLAALPLVIARLCGRWDLTVEGLPWHGYLGVVIPVRHGATPLALKVSWIDEWSRDEHVALRAWDGNGAVALVDADPAMGALLLERLDPTRTLEAVPEADAIRIAGELMRRLVVAAPPGLRSVADEMRQLQRQLRTTWEQCGRPFPEALVAHSLALAEMGIASATMLVNHDLHYGNVLGGTREPWLVIDPKVLVGPIEYGVAPLLWNRFAELQGVTGFEHRLDRLVHLASLDERAAREWSLIRVVEYWLWALSLGHTEDAGRCRQLVAWLSPEYAS